MNGSNWASWSIRHRQIIYFFIFLTVIMGVYAFKTLGRSEDPTFAIKQMIVTASWPGATAREMEELVTDKLEKEIQNVPNIDYLTSYSRPGVCVINVYLKETVPQKEIRQRWLELRNIVNDARATLPQGVSGPFFNDRFDDVYGNIYAVTSESFSYEEMRLVAEKIKQKFFFVPDVKKVELIGVQPQKIYIRISSARMAQLGLGTEDIAEAVKAATSVYPSGTHETRDSNIYLRLTGMSDTLDNLRAVPIAAGGRILRLGDIAEVGKDYADPPEPKMYFNGLPAIGIALSMEERGNNITLGENLDRLAFEVRNELPLGFSLEQVANQPRVVKNAIGEFSTSLFEAIAIVMAVSLLTLGRSSGFVISVCIPLVLLATFIGMYLLGIDLHKVSLGALIVALGMLVDDSIVVVDLMEVKLAEGWDREKAASHAFAACARPLLTGTLITCAGFMPIAFSSSSASEFAGSLFPVISLALLLSWLVSATVAPVLGCAWIRPRRISAGENLDTPFYRKFRMLLSWSLKNRALVLALTAFIFLSSLLLLNIIKKEFFPASVRPEILVELNLPEGSSLKATEAAALKLTNLIKDDDAVERISSYIGESAPRFVLVIEPVQPRTNYAQIIVVAKDLEQRAYLEGKIKKLASEHLPEAVSYSRSIPLGPPSPYPVMIRVTAESDALARRYAFLVREKMLEHPSITMTRFDWMEKSKSLKVEIDNDKLRQMGLSRKTVSAALQSQISGYKLAEYLEGDQALDVIFRLREADRASVEDLAAVTIPTSSGAVPLAQIARIEYDAEDNMLWRRNLLPTITVCGGIAGDKTDNDVTREVFTGLKELRQNLPSGVKIEIGGSLEKSKDTLSQLLKPVPAMIIIILVLLMLQLKDIRKVFVIICTAPLGIIGVMLGLVLFKASLGFMAELGILALTGIIIRNSVVLIDQISLHLDAGLPPRKAVLEAALVRFRPIMLAALTTILGLLPMFASPFWHAMAVAIACGLTAATVLTLVVLPVIYAAVYRIREE